MTLPVEGVRILAVTQFGAGPFAAMTLADLGAEVIKIEDPTTGGDVARYVPPHRGEGDSLYFQSFNRNNRSLTLNLKTEAGREVLRQLAAVSDAVLGNLKPGAWRRLGLDYASLRAANPRIVCCLLSAYGATGPRSEEPGYDFLMQAYAGYMTLSGEPDGPPARCGVSLVDYATGYAAALGLVAAVLRARTTGQGGEVDVSLLDTAVAMLNYLAIWNLNRDFEPSRLPGGAHQSLVPVQTFATRDGHIVIFCAKEHFWQALCRALERPDLLEEERFADFAARLRHRGELVAILEEVFRGRTTGAWLERLRGRVPCAPVNTLSEALQDEQLVAREMIVEVDSEAFGRIRQVGSPIKVSGASPPLRAAPSLGADTEVVLRDLLGYSGERIERLREAGAV